MQSYAWGVRKKPHTYILCPYFMKKGYTVNSQVTCKLYALKAMAVMYQRSEERNFQ